MYFYDLFLGAHVDSLAWSKTNLIAYECKPELLHSRVAFDMLGAFSNEKTVRTAAKARTRKSGVSPDSMNTRSQTLMRVLHGTLPSCCAPYDIQ
jgi:hypothetical protein